MAANAAHHVSRERQIVATVASGLCLGGFCLAALLSDDTPRALAIAGAGVSGINFGLRLAPFDRPLRGRRLSSDADQSTMFGSPQAPRVAER